ncbi:hypothetical protein [Nocardia carnea]|uniref:hypothetical protein n=1 Tax=Nocardia carnea TaxID=37328 RepID=UPI0024558A8F|nr:hypothetical protein [Nocardia carnea]
MNRKILRRAWLVLASVLAVATGSTGVSNADPAGPNAAVALTLPAPTGPYSVGVTNRHLVDSGRADPWHPEQRRELMVHVWYPATVDRESPPAPWMPPGGRQAQDSYLAGLGVPEGSWTLAPSHSHPDAPAVDDRGRFPILLNSPGMTDTTGWSTAQAVDLASHGYVVVRAFFDAVFGRSGPGIIEIITSLARPEVIPHL